MIKNFVKVAFLFTLLCGIANAQMWLPFSNDPFFRDWSICHWQALPGNPLWTHRFQWDQMTPQQKALVQAIAMKEHGLQHPSHICPEQANVRGDSGNAVGPLQVWHSFFKDARWYEDKVAPHDDAYPNHLEDHCTYDGQDPLDYQMFAYFWWSNNCGTWWAWHSRYGNLDMLNMDADAAERIARKHNGGPNGHNNPATLPYWEGVKQNLKNHFSGVIPGIE